MDDSAPTLPASDGATLPATAVPRASARTLVFEPGPRGDDSRYALGEVLGRGGMGEVRLARDQRVERDVAVKLLRTDQRDDAAIARFFREARVQGRLDHPAVVPVHDLGIDRDGQPYFVMKRLTGTTLFDVLGSTGELRDKWPRSLLLARFVDVCLAIELAHTRDIVHRDLKPANIMLGDFGETYVLDWGLARVVGEPDDTAAGALLGTPGYMPPEQARGQIIDARADVYALGCILFEIVCGAPALPRGLEALDATLAAPCLRPSSRDPAIAVELDDLCARATAADREARPTARALAEGVQRYLDGDRDVDRRRALAAEHAARAEAALAKDLESGGTAAASSAGLGLGAVGDRDAGDSFGEAARAVAVREAGRALALDPHSISAQNVLARILLEAPDAIPAPARAAADAERALFRQRALRWMTKVFACVALIMTILLWFPIRHAWPLVLMFGGDLATCATTWLASRRPLPDRAPIYLVLVACNVLTMASGSIGLGPMLIVPIFLCTSLAGALTLPVGFRSWVIVAPHFFALALPLTLELVGATPSSFHIADAGLVLTPYAIELTPILSVVLFSVSIVTSVVIVWVLLVGQRLAQEAAQDRVHAQRWHLSQLLPRGASERKGARPV